MIGLLNLGSLYRFTLYYLVFPVYNIYINRYIRYVVTIKRYSIFRMVIIIQFTL